MSFFRTELDSTFNKAGTSAGPLTILRCEPVQRAVPSEFDQ